MFNVGTPVLTDKPEWTLNGQILNITLPLQETVSVIKTKIHELTGMPPGKQKLQCDVCIQILTIIKQQKKCIKLF